MGDGVALIEPSGSVWDRIDGQHPGRERFEVRVSGGDQRGEVRGDTIKGWIVRGGADGPKMLMCSGVHGDEYEGPRALQEMIHDIDPVRFRGTLVAVPVLNEAAMLAGHRCHPRDGRDLARVFPGQIDGSVSQRLAFSFVQSCLQGTDYFVDLHSASADSRIFPWAGYQMRKGRLQTIQRRMAVAFGLDIVWGTAVLPGRTLSAAGSLDIPAIYVEMPGEGRCRPEDVATNRRGINQVLAATDMMEGPFPTEPPVYFIEQSAGDSGELAAQHRVSQSGAFHPEVQLGDRVCVGDVIGTVVNVWGETVDTVRAELNGIVVYLRTCPTVAWGESACTVMPTGGACMW